MGNDKLNNKGFSLVELIIVIAIMTVLVGLVSPQFFRYVGRSKRAMDANNAAEYAKACQTSGVFNDYVPPTEADYYQGSEPTTEEASGIWTCGFRADTDSIDLENPSSFLDFFCAEAGCIPVSKTNKDFFWNVKYNRYNMHIIKIELIDGDTGTLYEVYPNGSDFIANGP